MMEDDDKLNVVSGSSEITILGGTGEEHGEVNFGQGIQPCSKVLGGEEGSGHGLTVKKAEGPREEAAKKKAEGPRLGLASVSAMSMGYSSSDSLDQPPPGHPHLNRDSTGVTLTPKLSSISGAKTETSSIDASMRSSSSRDADCSGMLLINNASDLESEWVEQDEPEVYITIIALPAGKRELGRVRFK